MNSSMKLYRFYSFSYDRSLEIIANNLFKLADIPDSQTNNYYLIRENRVSILLKQEIMSKDQYDDFLSKNQMILNSSNVTNFSNCSMKKTIWNIY